MTDTPTPPPVRRFIVCDQNGGTFEIVYAKTRDEAIDTFCRPLLRKEAFFGPDAIWQWTCEECEGD
jgi:hypothetical protein